MNYHNKRKLTNLGATFGTDGSFRINNVEYSGDDSDERLRYIIIDLELQGAKKHGFLTESTEKA